MPLYTYKAKDKKGKIVEEIIQTESKEEAASSLKNQGLQILTLTKFDSKLGSLFAGKISVSDKATFSRFLATMLRAGMPLPEALDIIRRETESKRLQQVLVEVTFDTRKGSSLSAAFSKFAKDFDKVFLTMIKAGEESGTLEKTFDYLAKQLLGSYEMMQKVKGAMIYPAVILLAMVGNGVLMIAFVLPKISEVFTKLNLELPPLTQLVLNIGFKIFNIE